MSSFWSQFLSVQLLVVAVLIASYGAESTIARHSRSAPYEASVLQGDDPETGRGFRKISELRIGSIFRRDGSVDISSLAGAIEFVRLSDVRLKLKLNRANLELGMAHANTLERALRRYLSSDLFEIEVGIGNGELHAEFMQDPQSRTRPLQNPSSERFGIHAADEISSFWPEDL